jgi:hypothetical protein
MGFNSGFKGLKHLAQDANRGRAAVMIHNSDHVFPNPLNILGVSGSIFGK